MRAVVYGVSLGLLLAAPIMGAEKVRLVDLEVGLEGSRVEVGFRLVNGFTDELVENIQSGLPSGFTFDIRLSANRKGWFDNNVGAFRLQVVAMYNAVTREYLVNFKHDGKLVDSRVVRDLEELERVMTRFEKIPAFNLGDYGGRRKLQVRARAELGSRNILYFIPSKVTTDWRQSRKFQPPTD